MRPKHFIITKLTIIWYNGLIYEISLFLACKIYTVFSVNHWMPVPIHLSLNIFLFFFDITKNYPNLGLSNCIDITEKNRFFNEKLVSSLFSFFFY